MKENENSTSMMKRTIGLRCLLSSFSTAYYEKWIKWCFKAHIVANQHLSLRTEKCIFQGKKEVNVVNLRQPRSEVDPRSSGIVEEEAAFLHG